MGTKVFEWNHTRVCNRHPCSLSPPLQTCAGAAMEVQYSVRSSAKATIATAVTVLKLLCKHTNKQFYKPDLDL